MSGSDQRGQVGIRELRQNLSIYVDRVKDGETLEVTEHGRPVAELGPLRPPSKSLIEQMLADGRIVPAKRPFELPDLLDLPDGAEPVSGEPQRMRDEDHH